MWTLLQIQQLISEARAMGLTEAEISALQETLLYRAAGGNLSVGEQTQLAIDQMELEQRDEINAGVMGLEVFMDSYQARAQRRLSEVDWSDDE